MKTRDYITEPLSMHKAAKVKRYFDNYVTWDKEGHYHLKDEWGMLSYDTKVIIIRGNRVLFTGSYSRTTSRQVTWFLEEFDFLLPTLSKAVLARMEKDDMAFNLKTNTLEPLTEEEKKEIKHIRQAAFNYGYGW